MSLIIFSAMLFTLAVFNYHIAGTYLYPPVIFSLFWAGLLFVLALSGNMFYSISYNTLFIYFMGALAFSTGAIIPMTMRRVRRAKDYNLKTVESRYSDVIINIGLIASILVFPYYCFKLYHIASSSGLSNLWVGLRYAIGYGGASIGWLAYLVAFVTFLAVFSYIESKNVKSRRIRAYILIALSLMYALLAMARVRVFFLIVSLLGVNAVLEKRVRLKPILIFAMISFIVFAIPAVLLGKGGSTGNSLSENVREVSKSVMVYLVGGVVAFDNVVKNPGLSSAPGITTFRFFLALLNRIGLNVDLPRFILGDTYTLTPSPTNVYTIYCSYFLDYGYVGIFIFLFIDGLVSSVVFVNAYFRSNKIFIFLYGMVIFALLISGMAENFFTSLSLWLQAGIFLFFVYKFPLMIKYHA